MSPWAHHRFCHRNPRPIPLNSREAKESIHGVPSTITLSRAAFTHTKDPPALEASDPYVWSGRATFNRPESLEFLVPQRTEPPEFNAVES